MHLAGRYSELLLASTSPARKALLDGLGLPYRAEAPGVDEAVPPGASPAQAVALLAERKARAVFTRNPGALVIGADQLVALDGATLGKPPDAAAARRQLLALRGRPHDILTGLCVLGPSFRAAEVDVARLTVVPLTEAEADAYVALGEWEGCAGGYRVEGRGQALFSRLDGDRTAIQGLPMARLVGILREAGVRFFARAPR
jgi:septum formation protein